MRIFRDINDLPDFKNAVITIGSFDGVHRGHQKIIKRINHLAKEIEGESIIITFDPHPRKVIYPKDNSLELLNSLEEKIALCEKYGIDNLVIVPFSIEFSQQNPREYIEKFLIGLFSPKYIVIGYDHRFGLNREGNILLLQEYAEEYDFDVIQIKKQELEDITISSTKVRTALKSGNIEEANQFSNHSYSLKGKVVHGDKIGQSIGYPTANIAVFEEDKLIPANGVYGVICQIEGLEKRGMLYIGTRPTLEGNEPKLKIEVNLFDFNDSIYDKTIAVNFLFHIRGDEKFDSLNALKYQLSKDKEAVLNKFAEQPKENNNKDKVCIAILNYNGEELLESYLPQVLYSSKNPLNIAVIDNASNDESVSYIQEWHPEIQVIELQKNYGFAEGYNRGLEYVEATYTVILNSDVSVRTNWLDPIIARMDADPHLAVVQPKILSLEEKSKFEYAGASGGYMDAIGYPYCRGRIFDQVEADKGQYDTIENIDWASGAAMVVRTDVFKQLGGFDKDYFAHMEEIDFCTRVRAAGYKIEVLPTSVVYHLGGGTLDYGNPRKIYLNFRNSLYTLFKNESLSKLLWALPFRLILDGVAGIKFLLSGELSSISAIIKAHWTFFGNIGNLRAKKKSYNNRIQKHKIGAATPRSTFSSSIVWDFYVRGKKHFSNLKKR
ncbi:MAG: bifunctional riboflavin kinase/FAD synthetase [Saprospiraceae bacterium]|nr:bifunctional riboflavin kinase/FAD synthetase [Saprospiraceae bacterium]